MAWGVAGVKTSSTIFYLWTLGCGLNASQPAFLPLSNSENNDYLVGYCEGRMRSRMWNMCAHNFIVLYLRSAPCSCNTSNTTRLSLSNKLDPAQAAIHQIGRNLSHHTHEGFPSPGNKIQNKKEAHKLSLSSRKEF